MIRTFLAVHPSPEVLRRIGELQHELQESDANMRWVDPGSMHLTIHFLGDVRESEMPGIERSLAESLHEQQSFDVECRGLGVFPNARKPRVLWVGLTGEGLAMLAERVEIVLAPLGFPPSEREFRPHLTLGRLRSPKGWESLAAATRSMADRDFGTSRIDEAVLYRSELRSSGSVYTPLATFAFGGGAASG